MLFCFCLQEFFHCRYQGMWQKMPSDRFLSHMETLSTSIFSGHKGVKVQVGRSHSAPANACKRVKALCSILYVEQLYGPNSACKPQLKFWRNIMHKGLLADEACTSCSEQVIRSRSVERTRALGLKYTPYKTITWNRLVLSRPHASWAHHQEKFFI